MKKRILSMLMCLCLTATLFPATVLALDTSGEGEEGGNTAQTGPCESVQIIPDSNKQAVTLYENAPYYVDGKAVVAPADGSEPQNWMAKFTSATGEETAATLTLKGMTLEGTISAGGNLNIVLEGNNIITHTVASPHCVALQIIGDTTISGSNGSLKAESSGTEALGIRAKALTVESGTITGISHDTGNNAITAGIAAEDIVLRGGLLSGEGRNGIGASQVKVEGGTLNAKGTDCGLEMNSLTVSGGTVTAAGTGRTSGSDGPSARGIRGENVTVSGGTVDSKADGQHSRAIEAYGTVTVSGTGKLTGTATGDDSIGIFVSRGNLTVNGGEITGTGFRSGIELWGGNGSDYIQTKMVVTGGTVTGTADSSDDGIPPTGIAADALTISGGEVTGTGRNTRRSSFGIRAQIVKVSDTGKLTGTGSGNGTGIGGDLSNGPASLTVTGGTVTGTGNDAYGIDFSGGSRNGQNTYYKGTISVSGGEVTGTGNYGVAADHFTVSDTGNVTAKSVGENGIGLVSDYQGPENDTVIGVEVNGGKLTVNDRLRSVSLKRAQDAQTSSEWIPVNVRVGEGDYTYRLGTDTVKAGPIEWGNQYDGYVMIDFTGSTKPGEGGGSGGGSRPSGGGSSGSSGGTTTSKPVTNPDGSTTTKTENKTTGTVTETTKAPDGSQTVVETQKNGTVTTTATDKDGNKTETVAKTDGSSVTKVEQKDGTTASVTIDPSGKTQAEVKVPAAVAQAAQQSGKALTLPIPAVQARTVRADAPEVTVSTGSSTPVKVEIPTANPTPGTVAVLVHDNGTEEVIKTSLPTGGGVAVALADGATVKIVDNSKTFADVPADNWAADAVAFSSARELFDGTGENTFTPDAPMTRAMLVTVLARFDGTDTSGGENWYDKGLTWAVENQISDGSSPEVSITREQLAVMLWRYAGSPESSQSLDGFRDTSQISDYAQTALAWAHEQGIVNGFENGTLAPQGQATRAQVAQMLANFIQR